MGAINLKHTGSGADIALSSDGTSLLLDGTAVGGALELFAENPSSPTAPSATGTNAVAIGSSSNANSSASIALGDSANALGSDTLVLQKGRASGTQATSIAVHNNSSAYGSNHLGAVSIGSHAKSTQDYSFALGWYSQADANYAMAFGRGANAGHISSVAIGHNAATTSANQIALGSTSDTVKISGTYTLPTSDGTNGQVLTTDGSGAVTFADAGGAASELYAENPSSPTAPSATGTNAVAVGNGSTASGDYANSFGDGTASGNYSTAIGYFTSSTGLSSLAAGSGAWSGASHSTAIGRGFSGSATTASGVGAMALGDAYASGTDSLAAAIANNTASYGATSANTIVMGKQAKATNSNAIAMGETAIASGMWSAAMGRSNEASSTGALALGYASTASGVQSIAAGAFSIASQQYSIAMGHRSSSSIKGKLAYASNRFSGTGDAQQGTFVLLAETTGGLPPEEMTTDGSLSASNNLIVLPNNSAYAFHGTIVARQKASEGTASAAWKVEGLIRREGSAGTTVLVNSATTVLDNTPSWGLTLVGDTLYGGLNILVTGAASTNIRWVATIHTSEVTYA